MNVCGVVDIRQNVPSLHHPAMGDAPTPTEIDAPVLAL